MLQTLEHLALSGIDNHDTASVLSMQTGNERLLSTRVARHRERGLEIHHHAFRASSRPSSNRAHAISLQIQVPERKERVDQVIQRTSGKCPSVVQGGPERSWSTKGGRGPRGPPDPLRSILIHTFSNFY